MNLHELQIQVTDWLIGLPQDATFDAAVIVATTPKRSDDLHLNYVGVTTGCTGEQYQQCCADILENGAKHGFLSKTISMKP